MTTALARYTSPAQLSIQEMMSVGDLFYQSGLFADIRGAAQATTKIIAGQELGIPPFASMNGFHIIKGKAAMGANLIGATIKRSGKYDYIVREMTPERCLIEFYQVIDGKRESIGKSDFTVADAKKAGTQNLDKYPRNMLFARAMSNGARWFTPDVFLGPIYTPEELGEAVDEAGDIIPGSSYEEVSPPATDKQRRYIGALQDDLGWHSEYMAQFAKEHKIDLAAMTAADAGYLIEQMKAALDEPAKATKEPKTPPPADDLIDLPEFAAAVKKLRNAAQTIGIAVPVFTRKQAQERAALELEWVDSRRRLYDWLTSKIDAAPALEELDDKSLMDLAYATAGL